MGDSARPKFYGALLECFLDYPQFREDFSFLVDEGYVKITSPENCEWTKSVTSLAQYFKWCNPEPGEITGGRWSPVARCFGVGQRSLSKGASHNGNELKKLYSKDFKRIKPVLDTRREKRQKEEQEQDLFAAIKQAVMETGDTEPEKVHEALEKIKSIFPKIVDKKPLLRR